MPGDPRRTVPTDPIVPLDLTQTPVTRERLERVLYEMTEWRGTAKLMNDLLTLIDNYSVVDHADAAQVQQALASLITKMPVGASQSFVEPSEVPDVQPEPAKGSVAPVAVPGAVSVVFDWGELTEEMSKIARQFFDSTNERVDKLVKDIDYLNGHFQNLHRNVSDLVQALESQDTQDTENTENRTLVSSEFFDELLRMLESPDEPNQRLRDAVAKIAHEELIARVVPDTLTVLEEARIKRQFKDPIINTPESTEPMAGNLTDDEIQAIVDESGTGSGVGIRVDTGSGTKKCSKCLLVKPLSEYYKDKRAPDGHKASCKACNSKAENKPTSKQQETHKSTYGFTDLRALSDLEREDEQLTKECSQCHNVKPYSAFSRKAAAPTGRRAQCKECEARYRHDKEEAAAATTATAATSVVVGSSEGKED